MKRDWFLIRNILQMVETDQIEVLDADNNLIHGHCLLLRDDGYIDFETNNGHYSYIWITHKGYDLLELLDENAIFELQASGYPVTEYMLQKYAEFELEKDLFDVGE